MPPDFRVVIDAIFRAKMPDIVQHGKLPSHGIALYNMALALLHTGLKIFPLWSVAKDSSTASSRNPVKGYPQSDDTYFVGSYRFYFRIWTFTTAVGAEFAA